jgi:hypothetical protein
MSGDRFQGADGAALGAGGHVTIREDIEKLEGACVVLANQNSLGGLSGIRVPVRNEVLLMLRSILESKRRELRLKHVAS